MNHSLKILSTAALSLACLVVQTATASATVKEYRHACKRLEGDGKTTLELTVPAEGTTGAQLLMEFPQAFPAYASRIAFEKAIEMRPDLRLTREETEGYDLYTYRPHRGGVILVEKPLARGEAGEFIFEKAGHDTWRYSCKAGE